MSCMLTSVARVPQRTHKKCGVDKEMKGWRVRENLTPSSSDGDIIRKQTTGPTLGHRDEDKSMSVGTTFPQHGKRYVASRMEVSKTMARALRNRDQRGTQTKMGDNSKIAVLLKVGAAMASEVIGVCVLTCGLCHNVGACLWTTLRVLVDGQTCL